MKKIHKTPINNTKIQSDINTKTVDLLQLLPKILKIIPNFDFLKQKPKLVSNSTSNKNLNPNQKAAINFIKNHSKIIKEIKK